MSRELTRDELAAERRRLLTKARRHERRADRMPSITRPLRSVTTALLRADLTFEEERRPQVAARVLADLKAAQVQQAMTAAPEHASDIAWESADADDHDYHPRRRRG